MTTAVTLKANQEIKFSDNLGTHTVKVSRVERSLTHKNQVVVKGTILSTTDTVVLAKGNSLTKYFRLNTKVKTL